MRQRDKQKDFSSAGPYSQMSKKGKGWEEAKAGSWEPDACAAGRMPGVQPWAPPPGTCQNEELSQGPNPGTQVWRQFRCEQPH